MAGNDGALLKRDQIEESYRWDLSTIFHTAEDWEAAWKTLQASISDLEAYRGRLNVDGRTLFTCLEYLDTVEVLLGKVFVYATMTSHEDMRNQDAQAMADKAMALNVRVSEALSFLVPEILEIDEDRLWRFVKDEPRLETYRLYLERIVRQKPHVLSAREEGLLAGMGEIVQAPEHMFSMLTDGDMVFPSIDDEAGQTVELSEERYYRCIRSRNRTVRRDAFLGIHGTYEGFKNTLAASLSASVKGDAYLARVHSYGSSREAALEPREIPLSIYDNLLSTVEARLPVLHEYVALRKRALGLDELHMYDLYVPLVDDPDTDISWESAKSMVLRGLEPLGEEYGALLRRGMDERWIDVYESQGKRKGAYSWGSYGTNPFVLLNYNGTIRDVFTLAHELGHSLHSWHSHRAQPPVYGDYTIFVAEVASTTNEVLLLEHLLKESPEARPFLLNYCLEQVRTTVFRQTMFARFELEIHRMVEEGTPLTPEGLCSLWSQLNREYYGPEITIDQEIGIEWARIPHFYSAFYVYQYATGYSAATALAEGILKEGAPARARYLDFLAGGSSCSPIELLRRAGVDMARKEPVEATLDLFKEKLDELAALI